MGRESSMGHKLSLKKGLFESCIKRREDWAAVGWEERVFNGQRVSLKRCFFE
jgi:hypothetical protein